LSTNNDEIKSMANLLRSGATLTSLSCPVCSSPIFRLKNESLWCAKCQKKVIVVKEDEQINEIQTISPLEKVEYTLTTKILEINDRIKDEKDITELHKLSLVLTSLLDNLDKAKKVERQRF